MEYQGGEVNKAEEETRETVGSKKEDSLTTGG